ncbi:MAG TPA: sigma 54-interacting transcriptional regulator [Thermoanaerobaculia bacterium]|nr:sigma 54-interacting transcriptional regulator [Thermoanaerobaculia bacterium]HQR65855.1 sigma 54-interacting transcriptional regulator [Thermoanaerobaculia bacterium]
MNAEARIPGKEPGPQDGVSLPGFESLLLDLSARFVNLKPEQVDHEISAAQEAVCEFLGLDHSALWQIFRERSDDFELTHIFGPGGLPPLPVRVSTREFFPWIGQRALAGETIVLESLADLPPEASVDREAFRRVGTRATVIVPLSTGTEAPFGAISFAMRRAEREWPEELVRRLRLLAHVFANALARRRSDEALRTSLEEVRHLRDALEAENVQLREQVGREAGFEGIVGESAGMLRTLAAARKVAGVSSAVLIVGETGTGKEIVANAIHALSPRAKRPLVKVNCAALPPTLIESELFGREKGAYTGAMTQQAGRFELADGSTLFLDEIGELPVELQTKLLRVLEEGRFERLGGSRTLTVDVRVLAATNRDLALLVKEGRFRADLYYRLNVFPIEIPPLRERPEDIPLLVWSFVRSFSQRMGKLIESIPKKTMERLQAYPWPGNVRELRNVIERAMILSDGPVLRVGSFAPEKLGAGVSREGGTLEEVERAHIVAVLERTRWRVSGEGGAAELLGLNRTTLQSRMKKLGIERRHRPGAAAENS